MADPELDLITSLKEFERCKLKAIRKIPAVKCATISLNEVDENKDIEAPLWLLKYLLEKGMVTLSDDMLRQIKGNVWRQLAQPDTVLAKVDPNLYILIHLYLRFIKKNPDLMSIFPTEDHIKSMVNKRYGLVTKCTDIITENIESRLTFEEKILLKRLKSVFEAWNKYLYG
ncbi:MAG: hypothetical protein QXH96_00115 [Candidatus Geothermarchaeota archaeon]